MTKKDKSPKDTSPSMTLEEAATLLKKLKEWDGVCNMERETIIKWAEYLKKHKVES